MLSENQRVILGDALDALQFVNQAARIKDEHTRLKEVVELLDRVKDDIHTVLRTDK